MRLAPHDLRQMIVFKDASDADLEMILEKGLTRSIEEGEFFFFQGDPAEYAYVLTGGAVKLLQTNPSGQQVNLRTIYPWEMFAALGSVRGQSATYPVTAQALQDSTALALESAFLQDMLQTRPSLAAGLMQLMTSYIQEMQSRYRELATERVEQRIARALLRLAAQSGQKVDKDIQLSFSRQDVAEMSGTTLYTVSRVMAEWERQGLVQLGREQVRITNPHGLVKIAEGLEK